MIHFRRLNSCQMNRALLAILILPCLIVLGRQVTAQESQADLVERCEKSVVRIEVKSADGDSLGSGFIVDQAGTMVTNVHVLAGATSATATLPNNQTFQVRGTVLLDPSRDIAIAKLEGPVQSIPPIKLAGALPRKAERVIALGSPHGLSFTATSGVISAIRPAEELSSEVGKKSMQGTWIQVDAALSPGNSGGPIINELGQVVGMSTLASQGGAQNLNFGISAIDIAAAVAKSTMAPLVSLEQGAGRVVMKERESRESGGIIKPQDIPEAAINSYVDAGRSSFKDLMREMRVETEKLKSDMKEMRRGETYIPPNVPEPDADIVRIRTGPKRTPVWFFRDSSIKQREITRADTRIRTLTKLTTELKDPTDRPTLHKLLTNYGPKLDGRRKHSVGFLTDAVVLHSFNEHDAIVVYNDAPYLLYLESTSGLALGQEVAPIPVFVAGTTTAQSRSGATASFTVLQAVSDKELRQSIFGSEATQPNTATAAGGQPAANGQAAANNTMTGPTTASSQPADSSLFSASGNSGGSSSGMRTWYDRSGSFSVEALLLSATDKEVVLRKPDGKVIKVPRERLSDADQKYLRQ